MYANQHLSEIVMNHSGAARVFEAHGLDFCCHGKRPLREACEAKGIATATVEAELVAAERSAEAAIPSAPDELIDHIISRHHSYVQQQLPLLLGHTGKVAAVHGERHPEMLEVYDLFEELAAALDDHLMKEEQVLFPYIRALVESQDGAELPQGCFGSVASPIQVMEMEHDHAGEILERIRGLTNDYTPPANACTTFQLTLRELREFTEDLHIHIHKENNILHPGAIALELAVQGQLTT